MKIVFVCENYYPHYGGAEVVFKNLAEGFFKKGHEVLVITRKLPKTKKYEVINGVKIRRVRSFNSRYGFTFTAIPIVLTLTKDADIIQTTTFNGAPPAWLAATIRKKPVILTVHEVWVNKWNIITNLGKLSCAVHNFLEKIMYLLPFDKYICVSEATRKDLLNLGISAPKVLRVYNGFDYDFWDPARFDGTKIRSQLGLEKSFLLLAWGRPGTSKGLEYAVKSMPLISKSIPNAMLLLILASTESYKKKTRELRALCAQSSNIKILHAVLYTELGHYIKAADIALIPSTSEGFGYSAVEACTLGKVVVASEVGSLPEVVSGKFLLVKPKDPEAIAAAVIKAKKGQYNTTPLKKFPWEEAINSYLSIYEKLAKPR